jgi:hypothetical protein
MAPKFLSMALTNYLFYFILVSVGKKNDGSLWDKEKVRLPKQQTTKAFKRLSSRSKR